jgi:hypothetical protein
MMTVAELIAKLQTFDGQLTVMSFEGYSFTEVELDPTALEVLDGHTIKRTPTVIRTGEDVEGGGIYEVKEVKTKIPKFKQAPAVVLS